MNPRAFAGSRVAAAGACFLGALGYLMLLRPYGFQVEDEGTLLSQFDRVSRGQVPYLDFHTGYTPGFFYGGAAVYGLLERSALAVRTVLAFINAATAAGLYVIGRRMVGSWMAALAPVLWLTLMPFYPGEFAALNVPYPTWPATAAWVVVVLALLRWERTDERTALALAGLAAAAALAVRPDAGAFALAGATWVVCAFGQRTGLLDHVAAVFASAFMAVGVWFAFDFRVFGLDALVHLLPTLVVALGYAGSMATTHSGRPRTRTIVALAVLAAAFLIPSAGWMMRFLSILGTDTFLREVLLIGADYGTLYYTGQPTPTLYAVVVVLGMLLVAGSGHLVRRGTLTPTLPLAGAAVGVVGVAWALSRYALMPEGLRASLVFQAENALFWLVPLANVGALVALAVLGRRMVRGTEHATSPTFRTLAVVTPLAIAMYLQLYPRSDFMHQITAAPLSLVVGIALLDRVLGWWERGRWPSALIGRRVVRGTLLIAIGILVTAKLSQTLVGPMRLWTSTDPAGTRSAALPVGIEPGADDDLEALQRAAQFIRMHTSPDDPVWSFPATSGLLFAAGRSNPLEHDYWFPGRPNHEAETSMVAHLRAGLPRLVVTLNSGWTFFQGAPAYFQNARALAVEHYRLAARFGRFDILARTDAMPEGAVVLFQPNGPLVDAMEPQLARRRQATRRWMATLTPAEAAAAEFPASPRRAVLLLRGLRDGGDIRAAGWAIAGYASANPQVRRAALAAMAAVADDLDARRLRWANDFVPNAYALFLQPHAAAARRMLQDADPTARRFAEAVLELAHARTSEERASRQPINTPASQRRGSTASFSDTEGAAIGQVMPRSGSLQSTPTSSSRS